MPQYGANGYFPAPAAPAYNPYAQPPQGAFPSPVVVNVNNYQQPRTQVDAYIQQAQPYMPVINGLTPGLVGKMGVAEAKGHYFRASNARAGYSKGGGRAAKTAANARAAGRSSAFGSVLNAAKWSVIINGAISVGVNGWKLFTNQQTKGQAAGNVTGDLMSAAVGGLAGGAASALGTTLLSGFLGTGMIMSVAGMALGVVGYMVADAWLKNQPFYMNIKNKVASAVGN